MTKSTITREQLEEWVAQFDTDGSCDATDRQLEALIRQSLAAMDSEPVGEFYEDGPLNWYQISDGDRVPAHRRIPLYRHAQQPVAHIPVLYKGAELLSRSGLELIRDGASFATDLESACMAEALLSAPQPAPEYPETLPCPVLLEPGLRFGKGIKTSTMLAALARRSVHESDMAALSPEEIAEFQERIEDFKSLIAQPVPDERDKAVDADDHPLLWSFNEGWNACRAAILQGADGKPHLTVWYGSMPETNGKTNWTAMLHRKGQHPWEGITIDCSEYPGRVRYEADRMRHLIGDLADEPDILAYDADAHSGYVPPAAPQLPGSEPATVPGKWIPVSERMPDCWCRTCRPVGLNDMRFVVCPDCGNKRCPRANDHRNACTGSNEPGQEGSAYPAAPQEVKDGK